MEGSPGVRVQIKYPHSVLNLNPEDKGFGFFLLVLTLPKSRYECHPPAIFYRVLEFYFLELYEQFSCIVFYYEKKFNHQAHTIFCTLFPIMIAFG